MPVKAAQRNEAKSNLFSTSFAGIQSLLTSC